MNSCGHLLAAERFAGNADPLADCLGSTLEDTVCAAPDVLCGNTRQLAAAERQDEDQFAVLPFRGAIPK